MSLLDDVVFTTDDEQAVTLRDAHASWREGLPYPLRPPGLTLLDDLDGGLEGDAASRLVDMLAHYSNYDPPVDVAVRDELLIRAILAASDDRVGFEVALAYYSLGGEALECLLTRIPLRPLGDVGIERLQTFVSYLLDHPLGRAGVSASVPHWPDSPLTHAIQPMLD